ncbi:laccase-2 isoform X2 [Solenopsis invicta]|uniref:laccase-2 isoform X2 n=1 Tax=Solenopsis invicta TaxID=13686 RepID=UPI00193E3CB0|nr:laccase-2 isoform X2 [Solenopsis invicta]
MQLLSISTFVLIFLNINILFCKAHRRRSKSSRGFVQRLSTPEECARECQDNEMPKNCYYHFVLEYYTTNNEACNFCDTPVNDSRINSSCQCVIGDGFEKTITSINRMLPGPSIQVCREDYLIIDLQNEAEGLEASIHWHGIFQNGYQYYDGVPFLTQCPILSSNTFRYQYKVKNSGTHLYHSHESVQIMDGQYGSLIVRDPPSLNPHKDLYDEDLPEHVILISDWFHELALERFPGRYRSNRGQNPDNILINGRGNWTNPSTGVSTNVSLSLFTVESGRRYRFRIISAFSTVCLAEIKIGNHSMQIIATDGENVQPVPVDAITMASGERVDFVLNANQTPSFYWLHVRGLGECQQRQIYQLGILAYRSSSMSSLPSSPGYFFSPSTNVFNPPNSTECGTNLCVSQLSKLYLQGEEKVPLNKTSDMLFILSFNFFNYSEGLNLLFDTKNQDYKRFFVSPTGSHLDSLVANISYQNPPGPLISQYDGYEFMCGNRYTPSTCTQPCTCTHVYHIPLGALIDVLLYDKSWWFFHCHFTWHTATGMNVVLHVGTEYDLPNIPSDFPQCYNWTPPIMNYYDNNYNYYSNNYDNNYNYYSNNYDNYYK